MAQTTQPVSIVENILHPTDFSQGSLVAFYHALKIALLKQSGLALLHVSTSRTPQWSGFPGVRATLQAWGVIPKGSSRSAVAELGIDARKVVTQENDPVEAVLRYLNRHPAELIVLATSQHEGRMRWLEKSVAEPVARRASQMTLFIPAGSDGFVSGIDGSVHLNHILIPIATTPGPQPALEAAARWVTHLQLSQGTFTLLHVGTPHTMPSFYCPEVPGWEWKREVRSGDVIESIVDAAKGIGADLIVMSTDGRNGFLDGLRGSHSERVLRHGVSPLLTIPIGSVASLPYE